MKLIPFGAGHKKFPGIELGMRTVQLVLAQLLHCFNWELPDGISPKDIGMHESFGLTTLKASPLLTVPTYHTSDSRGSDRSFRQSPMAMQHLC